MASVVSNTISPEDLAPWQDTHQHHARRGALRKNRRAQGTTSSASFPRSRDDVFATERDFGLWHRRAVGVDNKTWFDVGRPDFVPSRMLPRVLSSSDVYARVVVQTVREVGALVGFSGVARGGR